MVCGGELVLKVVVDVLYPIVFGWKLSLSIPCYALYLWNVARLGFGLLYNSPLNPITIATLSGEDLGCLKSVCEKSRKKSQ